jgi:TIR domain/NACHT domain/CobQ/CobB/MinD/ParA nucleotide binding domain
MVVTFYSFKGGVGRSMALANVAEILADMGYSVLVCDWDLEAPGLEQFLCSDEGEAADRLGNPGIIDLVEEYKRTLARPPLTANGDLTDAAQFSIVGGVPLRRPSTYAKLVPRSGRTSAGSIRLLSAGRRGGEREGDYTKAVRDSDWTEFYDKWAGGAYFEFLRQDLQSAAKIVLIDSRTGVTELGGVATHLLCDVVVLFSAANRQNVRGTEWMADILSGAPLQEQRQNRPLSIIPTAARIEIIAESKLLTPFLIDFKQRFARRVPAALGEPQAFLENSVIPYAPLFSFEETVVARAPESERNPTLFKPYQILADSLIRCGKAMGLLGSHEPGPEPINGEESNLTEPGRAETLTPSLVLAGEFFLSWSESDRDYATRLVTALKSAGLAVWSDLLDGALRPSEAIATQIQSAIARSTGYLILVPREPLSSWLEAEMNVALSRQARVEGYRVLVLTRDRVEQIPVELRRFPALPLGKSGWKEAASRVIAELLPTRTLVPETPAGTLFDSIKKPTERESRFFFGRDAEIGELIGYVEAALTSGSRTLIITGPAGSGKTTLVRAGIIPLFQQGLFGTKRSPWRIAFAAFHSANDPEAILMRAVGEAIGITAHSEDWPQLISACAALDAPLLLVIDNFEHVSSTDGVSGTFRGRLVELRASCSAGFFLIITSRTGQSDINTAVLEGTTVPLVYQLPPFRPEGIQQYLVGVARLLGTNYEAGLLDVITLDAIALSVTAPILGNVLQQLIERQEKPGILTHAIYRKFGGVEGILTSAAVPLIEKLDAQTEGAARQIITSLVHPRTGAIVERPREELLSWVQIRRHQGLSAGENMMMVLRDPIEAFLGFAGQPVRLPESVETLRAFKEEGIVQMSPEGGVRLTTDGILRTPIVQSWLKKDAEQLVLRGDLEDAAKRWNERDRSNEFLPAKSLVRKLPEIEWTTPLAYSAAIAVGRHSLLKAGKFLLLVISGYALALGIVITARQSEADLTKRLEESSRLLKAAEKQNTVALQTAASSADRANQELVKARAERDEAKAELKRRPTAQQPQLPQRGESLPVLTIPLLIERLSSRNVEERRSAPTQLALHGQDAVAPMLAALRRAKGEPDHLVEQGVAEALRQMKAAVSLTDVDAQTVVGLLGSDDQSTRTAVVDFLKGMENAQSLQNVFRWLVQFIDKRKELPGGEISERDVLNAITVIGTWAGTLDASIPGTGQRGLAEEAKDLLAKYRDELRSNPKQWSRTIQLIEKLLKAAEAKEAVQAR